MMQPLVSVIIPSYNRGHTLGRCIDSILAQTYRNMEIIVVDDCSTDDTVQVTSRYRQCPVPFKHIVLETKSGAQAARNRGIKESNGDWIAFQDSDDEWLPRKLEKQMAVLCAANFDQWTVVHSNSIWLDLKTGCRVDVSLPEVEGKDAYQLLLRQPGPMFQGMLVSRLALETINLLDEKVPSYQEWDTSIRLAKICRFIYMREPLFVYRVQAGDSISKSARREIEGYDYVIEKFKDEIMQVCSRETWENHLYSQLQKCIAFGFWAEADRYLDRIRTKKCKYALFRTFRFLHVSPLPFTRAALYVRSVIVLRERKNHDRTDSA